MTVTVNDINVLFRTLTPSESERAAALIPIVRDTLQQEAHKRGKDLNDMIFSGELMPNVLKSVIVDIVARELMTPTSGAPITQMTESAMGYSFTGSFLNPGGGLFIKRDELARLGLKRQRIGVIDPYGVCD